MRNMAHGSRKVKKRKTKKHWGVLVYCLRTGVAIRSNVRCSRSEAFKYAKSWTDRASLPIVVPLKQKFDLEQALSGSAERPTAVEADPHANAPWAVVFLENGQVRHESEWRGEPIGKHAACRVAQEWSAKHKSVAAALPLLSLLRYLQSEHTPPPAEKDSLPNFLDELHKWAQCILQHKPTSVTDWGALAGAIELQIRRFNKRCSIENNEELVDQFTNGTSQAVLAPQQCNEELADLYELFPPSKAQEPAEVDSGGGAWTVWAVDPFGSCAPEAVETDVSLQAASIFCVGWEESVKYEGWHLVTLPSGFKPPDPLPEPDGSWVDWSTASTLAKCSSEDLKNAASEGKFTTWFSEERVPEQWVNDKELRKWIHHRDDRKGGE